jgi:hypothetical protein
MQAAKDSLRKWRLVQPLPESFGVSFQDMQRDYTLPGGSCQGLFSQASRNSLVIG